MIWGAKEKSKMNLYIGGIREFWLESESELNQRI